MPISRGQAHKARKEPELALGDLEQSFALEPFYLEATLGRMINRGYYAGAAGDDYSEAAHIGLQACMIDPEC